MGKKGYNVVGQTRKQNLILCSGTRVKYAVVFKSKVEMAHAVAQISSSLYCMVSGVSHVAEI